MEYNKFREKIVNLQGDFSQFAVEFLDREGFKNLADRLSTRVSGFPEVCITGYFSEAIRDELEKYVKFSGNNLRIICQELTDNKRDRKNLEVLKKLHKAGAKIKVNNRLHARLLVAYSPGSKNGFLVLGSFDFNTECMGKERFDAGIKTVHPDLVESALTLFEQIWGEEESIPLNRRYPESKSGKMLEE